MAADALPMRCRFLGEDFSNVAMVDQLDDRPNVLFLPLRAIPQSAEAHDLELVQAVL